MTTHELANHLLTLPDLPVIINGWGSDEGVNCEVIGTDIIGDKEVHLIHEEVNWGNQ